MTFYLKPPSGCISLDKIVRLGTLRLKFLIKIRNVDSDTLFDAFDEVLRDSIDELEAVQEDTMTDRIAHFVLRLVADRGPRQFQDLFWSQETRLFQVRLRVQQDKQGALQLQRHLRQSLRDRYDSEMALSHDIITQVCDDEESVQVPFQMVPDLVSSRSFPLSQGQICIAKAEFDTLQTSLFKYLLKKSPALTDPSDEESLMKSQSIKEMILAEFFKCFQGSPSTQSVPPLLASDIGKASRHFPPCFQLVHQKLCQNHRLRHSARVAMTLYLKEIGLGLDQAIIFWSQHYSCQTESGSGCSHSWQHDEKRFIYSIRSLYGLEGSRKNYSSHKCSSIQRRCHSPHEQLVCPFKVISGDELHQSIRAFDKDIITEADLKEILAKSEADDHSGACHHFLRSRLAIQETPRFDFPKDFYRISLSQQTPS